MPLPVLNISAYKFVPLDYLGRRRRELREFCQARRLKGTILLSDEGINLFVAGADDGIEELVTELESDERIGQLEVKRSRSADLPFRRMLVKIKREIISFGVDGIDPQNRPSPKIAATTLKSWLDEGRELTLLDVRNDYEIELGTFENATAIGVDHFRHFPDAVEKLPEQLKTKPMVMFCTGGIRCEKAGPMMEQAGFQEVYQLDGGILKYFEDCGGEHYRGDCFVFDQRVSVDSHLQETETTMCFACQATLSKADQESPKYDPPRSCPHCFRPAEVRMAELVAKRRKQIRAAATPLPGSIPYENRRPLNVPQRCDGFELFELLCTMHPHVKADDWKRWIGEGQFVRNEPNGDVTLQVDSIVRAGERIEHIESQTVEPDVNADIQIIYEDTMLVVVKKPAPIPMHPCGRFNRNTVSYLLDQVYAPQKLRIAHRLDANTTGVVVLSRTKNVAARVQPQFEKGQVKKHYVARVHGTPNEPSFECTEPIVPRSTQAGARRVGPEGQSAQTEFDLICTCDDGTSLVRARPITGRTNQIRIHLAHLGFPIVGDPLYRGPGEMGERQTLATQEHPLCLHAHRIRFRHPEDSREVEFEAPLPDWAV